MLLKDCLLINESFAQPYTISIFIRSCTFTNTFSLGEWLVLLLKDWVLENKPFIQPFPKHGLDLKLHLEHQHCIFQCAILKVVH